MDLLLDTLYQYFHLRDIDRKVLYEMYKAGSDFSELITKGNTVPEGKKPVSGFDAVVNMKKKFKD